MICIKNRLEYVNKSVTMIILSTAIVLYTGLVQAAIIEVNPGESIQAAIDRANPGDIIKVIDGAYEENVEVNKQLTLRGINMPLVQAKRSGSTINVSADGCVIDGLMAANSSGWHQAGIRIISNGNIIANNSVKDNDIGIFIKECKGNSISHNDARNGRTGIFLIRSSDNVIDGNTASSHGHTDPGIGAGISLLDSCNGNEIYSNKIDMRGPLNMGILITESENNTVRDNTVIGNGLFSGIGIALLESKNNIIKNNSARSGGIFGQGIRLMFSSNNKIVNNYAGCDGLLGQAIVILQSSHNIISGNNPKGGLLGGDIVFEGSWSNKLIGNRNALIVGDP
ncbi:MAG TPA: NosD domain-containing protein [Methanotrichaceae archaeon]|nr:NosD domain-containing protein [Methanotrichaceae archaeon]